MVSSYTANLASFLVSESNIELITDVNSLVENAEKYGIRYGSKMKGATMEFFEVGFEEAKYVSHTLLQFFLHRKVPAMSCIKK